MQINRSDGVLGQNLAQSFVSDFIGKRQIYSARKDARFRGRFIAHQRDRAGRSLVKLNDFTQADEVTTILLKNRVARYHGDAIFQGAGL